MSHFNTLIKSWKNHEFSSGSYTGSDFIRFARSYKAAMKKLCSDIGAELIMGRPGHYYLNGFIQKNGKYIYFSIADVRHAGNTWMDNSGNSWMNHILIRTAKGPKDFTGGSNGYTSLENIQKDIESLLN